LKRIREKEPRFHRDTVRQKLAYDEHVLRRSGGRNAWIMLKGKIKGIKTKGRLKRMWFEDIRQ